MSFSPFLSAATLSLEGVRVDSFKPLHNDAEDTVPNQYFWPLQKLFTQKGFLRFKAKA